MLYQGLWYGIESFVMFGVTAAALGKLILSTFCSLDFLALPKFFCSSLRTGLQGGSNSEI